MNPFITPNWSAPSHIKAYTTLRYPGHSQAPYAGNNLAFHVGDNKSHVQMNRQAMRQALHLPDEPKWINQTHSTIALLAENISSNETITADASFTQQPNTICVVMTADCLPILVTNKEGSEVAAIHAGWRGLAEGIIENTLASLQSTSDTLIVWIGPSVSQPHYEVGDDVYNAFAAHHSLSEMQQAFQKKPMIEQQKWFADVPLLAYQRLLRLGVHSDSIYLSNECTYAQSDRYFSYRRDGVTGRLASMIFIAL